MQHFSWTKLKTAGGFKTVFRVLLKLATKWGKKSERQRDAEKKWSKATCNVQGMLALKINEGSTGKAKYNSKCRCACVEAAAEAEADVDVDVDVDLRKV